MSIVLSTPEPLILFEFVKPQPLLFTGKDAFMEMKGGTLVSKVKASGVRATDVAV